MGGRGGREGREGGGEGGGGWRVGLGDMKEEMEDGDSTEWRTEKVFYDAFMSVVTIIGICDPTTSISLPKIAFLTIQCGI